MCARLFAQIDAGDRPRRNARSCLRARLLTASSLVHVNSQPFLRQPVTRWISPVARQAHILRRQARLGISVGETWVLWACFIRGPRAGISTGRVSCRAAGYADVDTNSPAGQGFRARKVGIIRDTAGPLRCVPPEVD